MNAELDPGFEGEGEGPPPNPGRRKSLDRYIKKLPSGHGPVIIEELPGGGQAYVSEVPGRVAGSKAIYRKVVDDAGHTIGYM